MKSLKQDDVRDQIATITEELRTLYNAPDQARVQVQIETLRRIRQDLSVMMACAGPKQRI